MCMCMCVYETHHTFFTFRLASTYNYDTLECMFPNAPKCAVCGHEATKRCSYCKSEWYCRRQCQVEHWPKHKAVCAVLRKERGDGE
eukprot:m.63514 g.63514  ORF g.63514 m.63514 type:complete len:86 (+) comp11443_c0_seq4:743-1000(+)